MMLQRRPYWERTLAEFVAERMVTPFEWGKADCCLFAADAIQAITGVDPAERYRGAYNSKIGAHRLILAAGGLSGLVGLPEIDPALACRGDVVLIDTKDGEALAVHLGRTIAAQGPDGLVFLPLTEIEKAWKGGQ